MRFVSSFLLFAASAALLAACDGGADPMEGCPADGGGGAGGSTASAGGGGSDPDSEPFDLSEWLVTAETAEVVPYLGRQALHLRDGAVILGVDMADGIIEYDAALAQGPDQTGFFGNVLRLASEADFENIYLRADESGRPDAAQYFPLINGSETWQLYSGEGYEAAATWPYGAWFHVKIVVAGEQAELYVGAADKPTIFIRELKHEMASGPIGLWAFGADAWVSNFKYEILTEPPALAGKPAPVVLPEGAITSWSVSSPFAESEIGELLSADDTASLTWTDMTADETGMLNFSYLSAIVDDKNTVFASTKISAAQEEYRKVAFGFSDRVRVYLDNRLVYSAQDDFHSRHPMFNGVIGGQPDQLYLHLQPGEHEVLFAVSETDGGWGLTATLP
jgi:hypothetical protein